MIYYYDYCMAVAMELATKSNSMATKQDIQTALNIVLGVAVITLIIFNLLN